MNNKGWFLDDFGLPEALNTEELYDLFKKKNNGDEGAREKIIEYNIRLVLYEVANHFKTVNYDKKDLVSIGNIGLIKAVDTFDIKKGLFFSTYAARCIDNEINMFLRNLNKNEKVDSLERVIYESGDGNHVRLQDIVCTNTDVEEEYFEKETYVLIRNVVEKLSYREREVVKMYFGFYNGHIFQQEEIAEKLNISQSRVSRMITQILKDVRCKLKNEGIIEMSSSFTKSKKKTQK